MKARKWTAQQKMQIVLEGLKGKMSLTELCNRHQVSMPQYYKWRDRLQSRPILRHLLGCNTLQKDQILCRGLIMGSLNQPCFKEKVEKLTGWGGHFTEVFILKKITLLLL